MRRGPVHGFREIVVAAGRQFGAQGGPLQDQAGAGLVRRKGDRRVEQRLVGDDPARLQAAGGGDDRDRLGALDPGGEFGGGEAAEHDGVDRAQPRAGQHGHRRLWHHRHVDHDTIPAPDAQGRERARQPRHPVEQRGIGEGLGAALHRAVPDQRGLRAASGGDMAVEAVGAGVQLAAREPAPERAGIRSNGRSQRRVQSMPEAARSHQPAGSRRHSS